MKFDLGAFDLNGWDIEIESSVTGLKLMRCASWAEDSNHGGVISDYEVDYIFDDITEAQNTAGHTDYRKMFLYAPFNDVLGKTYTPSIIAPEAVASRFSIEIAAGSSSDTIASIGEKSFSSSLVGVDITMGNSYAIWLKRVITAEAGDIVYYRKLKVRLTVTTP